MSARNRELLALGPVAALVSAGFAAVFISQGAEVSDLSLTWGGYFLALCLGAHVFLRMRLPHADPYLFPLVALLAAIGLVFIYRIDDGLARDQANWFVIGLVLMAATVIFLRDHHVLERYRYLIGTAGIIVLLLPRAPVIGEQINGAYISVDLGLFSFQPGEIAKLCIIVFLASYLNDTREVLAVASRRIAGVTIPPLKQFGPLLLVWGAAMLTLVYVRELGVSLMFFGAFLALLYVATSRLSYVVIGLGLFAAGGWAISNAVGHVGDRFTIWLDPFAADAPAGAGQVQQSLYAQADGGLFGTGLGESLLRLPGPFFPDVCTSPFPFCGSILPEPHTDFIYAVVVSELGLFGATGLVLVYGLLAARGIKTALIARDGFSKLLAVGLTTVIALQAFVIVGGVVRVVPLTGVTLPFVSYGGSSVVANLVLVALLLIISDQARRPQGPAAAGAT